LSPGALVLFCDEERNLMRVSNRLLALAAPVASMALSACAAAFPAKVSRFQAMPAPAGQRFMIEPANPRHQGGLEFGLYAGLVRQHLIAQGYREAAFPRDATFVITLDYGVDNGRTKILSRPAAGLWGMGGSGYRPGYARFGNFSHGYPFHYGWNDAFWLGGGIDSETVYTSFVDLDIKRAADGQSLFEGSAKARSRTDDLQALVPNLVTALFTGFPGNSGETVRITVPPPARR
jgi:hypothetical protein